MKVMCINDKPYPNSVGGAPMPVCGETYIVIDEVVAYDRFLNPGIAYRLAGFPKNEAYDVKRFIPCSDIDETELVNQREEVLSA